MDLQHIYLEKMLLFKKWLIKLHIRLYFSPQKQLCDNYYLFTYGEFGSKKQRLLMMSSLLQKTGYCFKTPLSLTLLEQLNT